MPRREWLGADVRRCLEGRCIGINCPCLCHMKPPISHMAMRRVWRPAKPRDPRRAGEVLGRFATAVAIRHTSHLPCEASLGRNPLNVRTAAARRAWSPPCCSRGEGRGGPGWRAPDPRSRSNNDWEDSS
jgi:hypothetical protein